ncbi:MAG: MmcQ/YjbR family DNA-binding protein, partial [Clostridia bacterium]|nr:MmcQ/YjbR family DNA-binding protein [Clostridia bacterium]
SEKCFEKNIFKSRQAKEIIEYVRNQYGDELEFLWEKFPTAAIWRRKDNKKWYATLLVISKRKLGVDSDEVIDIIDLRIETEKLEKVVDKKSFFEGYHMNKKHWVTICLDDSVPTKEIIDYLNQSYKLAEK